MGKDDVIYTKLEVHNVLHCRQKDDRATVTGTIQKISCLDVLFLRRKQTYRHAPRRNTNAKPLEQISGS